MSVKCSAQRCISGMNSREDCGDWPERGRGQQAAQVGAFRQGGFQRGQIGLDSAQDFGFARQVEQGLGVTLSRIRRLAVVRHVLKYPLCSKGCIVVNRWSKSPGNGVKA